MTTATRDAKYGESASKDSRNVIVNYSSDGRICIGFTPRTDSIVFYLRFYNSLILAKSKRELWIANMNPEELKIKSEEPVRK